MKRSARGFTLLELMVALVLLALGLIGVLEAITKGLVGSRAMEDYQTGVTLARLQMNETLLLPELPYGVEEGDFGETYPGFTWRSEVESLESSEESDLALVAITVSWRRGAREQHYRLQTLWSEGLRDTLLGSTDVGFGAPAEEAAGSGGASAGSGLMGGATMGAGTGLPAGGTGMGGLPGGGGFFPLGGGGP